MPNFISYGRVAGPLERQAEIDSRPARREQLAQEEMRRQQERDDYLSIRLSVADVIAKLQNLPSDLVVAIEGDGPLRSVDISGDIVYLT